MFTCWSMIEYIIFWCEWSLIWKSTQKPCTSLSLCEAEVCSTNQCTKIDQHLRHVLSDLLHIDLPQNTEFYNKNHKCVYWSKSLITKIMKHPILRENNIRGFVHNKELEVHNISGKLNVSDIFTKERRYGAHFRALRYALMRPIPQ